MFIPFLNKTTSFLLDMCTTVLSTTQLPKPWKQGRDHHPHFLSHAGFMQYLPLTAAITKDPALQKYAVFHRNKGWSLFNFETVN